MESGLIRTEVFSDIASAWLPILADVAIKGTLLLVLAGTATLVMRRASAATRHLVWLLALASLPALPLLSIGLPGWHVLPGWMAMPADAVERAPSAAEVKPIPPDEVIPTVSPVEITKAPIAPGVEHPNERHAENKFHVDGPVASAPPPPDRLVEKPGSSKTWIWQVWVLLAWLAGTGLALMPMGLGRLSLWRVQRTAAPVTDGPWAALLEDLAAEIGVRRRLTLLLSDSRSMPMQWGIFWPKLLLPSSASRWSAERVRVVLLHELGHVRRWDCLAQLIAQIACALCWFNPLAWIALGRMQLESEAACDDLTIRAGCTPSDYARYLLEIASGLRADAFTAYTGIAMARPSRLEGRLVAILDPKRNRRRLTGFVTVSAACLLGAVVLPLSMLRAHEDAGPKKKVSSPELSESDAEETPNTVQLGHVDDSAEGKRSIGGSGHAVKFDCPQTAKYVTAVRIYGSRYGYPQPPNEDFHVYLLDEQQKVIKDLPYPYAMIERGQERWYTLKVPAIEVPEQFFVALSFNPHRTKGIYLGIDENVKKSHSYVGLPNRGFEPVSDNYDWMIRTDLVSEANVVKDRTAPFPPVSVSPDDPFLYELVRLGHTDDSAEGKWSIAGSGHAVAFDRPAGAKNVTAIQIYGSRYGYPQPPDEDFHVYLLDQDRKVIKDLPYPYARIERGRQRWYTLEVPGIEVPKRFYVALSFNPHQTKGIYLGFDKSVSEPHSYTGLPGSGFSPVAERYDWMVRVFLVPDADTAKH